MSASLSENPGLSAILRTDLLKCPLCHVTYTKPRLLPCLHTVCNSCLQRHLTVAAENSDCDNGHNGCEEVKEEKKEEEKTEEKKEKEVKEVKKENQEKTKTGEEGKGDGEDGGKIEEEGEKENADVIKDEVTTGKSVGEKREEEEPQEGPNNEEKKKEKKVEERKMKPSFQCPECKTSIPTPKQGAEGFQTNYFLMALVDLASSHQPGKQECDYCRFDDVTAEATSCCLECQDNMCSSCTDAHRRTKITRQHQVLLFSEIPSGKYDNLIRGHQKLFCKRHTDQPISYFCNKCESIICDECKATQHSEHVCSLLQTAGEGFIHQTQKSLSLIRSKIPKIQDHLKFIEEYTSHVGEMHEEIRSSIEAHTLILHKVIDKYKNDIIKKLESAREAACLSTTKRQEDLSTIHHIYETTLGYLDHLLEYGKHEEMLAARRSITDRLTQLICLTLDNTNDNIHLRFTPGLTDKANLRAVFGKVEVSYAGLTEKKSSSQNPKSSGFYGIKPNTPISSQHIPRMESMVDLRQLEDF